jgi:regulator of RNase E activity RraA
VTVHSGDIVFGDIDGVLIIPRDIADEVLARSLEKAAGEKKVRAAIESGMSATQAFAEFGIL